MEPETQAKGENSYEAKFFRIRNLIKAELGGEAGKFDVNHLATKIIYAFSAETVQAKVAN